MMAPSLRPRFHRSAGAVVVLLSFAGVDALYAQTCLDCHEESQPPAHSTHVSVPCASCHIEHEEFPHSPEATSLGCAQCHSAEADETALGVHGRAREEGNDAAPDCGVCHGGAHAVSFPGTTPYRRETIETCGMCHTEQAASFKESVHGTALSAGIREAPTCTDCHGEHAIQSPLEAGSPTQVLQIRETCAQCHADVALMARFGLPTDRVVSFDASFHGLANRAGSQTVANCSSCHGIHDILPSLDPRSKIHAANLADTCGSCHPGAGSRFALEPIHVLEGEGQNLIADLIRNIYLVLIPVVIGLMAVHNGGDWLRKLVGRAGGSSPSVLPVVMEVRMLPAERLQHALLAISFIVLTWTGFALKFPEQFSFLSR